MKCVYKTSRRKCKSVSLLIPSLWKSSRSRKLCYQILQDLAQLFQLQVWYCDTFLYVCALKMIIFFLIRLQWMYKKYWILITIYLIEENLLGKNPEGNPVYLIKFAAKTINFYLSFLKKVIWDLGMTLSLDII